MLHHPNNLQKYAGVIKQNLDRSYYTFSYQSKASTDQEASSPLQVKKRFPYYDLPSHDVACEAAMAFKRAFSIEHGLVVNPYRYSETDSNIIEVQLNVPNKFLVIDVKDLPLIEAFDWRIQNHYRYATCYLNDADFKKFQEYLKSVQEEQGGSSPTAYVYANLLHLLEEKDESSITSFSGGKRHYIPFHTMKYGLSHVDFLNGDPLDNRDANVGSITERQHRWKAHTLTAKGNRSNTSGKTGVFHGKCGNYEYWEVRGRDFQGNRVYKKFSVTKHGYEGAKWMASHFRDLVIDQSYQPHQLEEIYQKVIHDFECKTVALQGQGQECASGASLSGPAYDPTVPIRILFDDVVEDEQFIYSITSLHVDAPKPAQTQSK